MIKNTILNDQDYKSTFPQIDLVYLWCDGNDPDFLKRKSYYVDESDKNEESVGNVRFNDNEELKYSLRSVEYYANWINHIYIVTDRQIPQWLDVNNPRITVVDHSEIIPSRLIPVFNSSVIERYISRIPGLSEYFIYGNDDVFFGNEVKPNYFFQKMVCQ